MKNIAKIIGSGLLLASVSAVQADQQILDDLIVDGSACIGQDCVNGESFGFDTIRIKENNLRIKAQDTSSTASFPTQDWQITFNDSTNGGLNKFAIDAVSPGSSTPFTIEGVAPSHSLYVDDGGRVGFGTSTPVADLHVKSGNTPTLRLEQDGSSGFTAQTWDLAGNEANFFLRDATNGSTLPFRVFPAAPSNSLNIEGTTGDIGMGTTSPDAALEVQSGSAAVLKLANTTGGVNLQLDSEDSGNFWNITAQVDSTGAFVVNNNDNSTGDGGVEFTIKPNGNLLIDGTCMEFDNGGTPIACTAAVGSFSCASASCP